MAHDLMTPGPLTIFDFFLMGCVLLSAILGFLRGFTKEILTLGAWIGAVIITLYGMVKVQSLGRSLFPGYGFITDVGSLCLLFILSLVISSLLIGYVSQKIQSGRLGSLDRSLGFIFGGLRGWFLCLIGYMGIVYVWPAIESRPSFVRSARLHKSLMIHSSYVYGLLPSDLQSSDFRRALNPEKPLSSSQIASGLVRSEAAPLSRSKA